MVSERKHLQKMLLAGYVVGLGVLLLVYFLSGYLPDEQALWRGLLQDLFLNLAIALTISCASYYLLRPLLVDRDRKSLEDFQKAALELLTLEKGVREAGVVRIYESLSDETLQERLAAARQRVCFLSIWMDHPEKRFGKVFENLAKSNVKLRFLLASPESEVCKIRADSQTALFPEASSYEPAFISRIVQANQTYFSEVKTKTGLDLELRLFDLMPPFSLVLIDNSAFVSFYGYGQRVAATPHIEFRFEGQSKEFQYFSDFVLSQFEAIWDSAAKVV